MPQHRTINTGFLRSLDGTFGELQIVAAPGRIVLDIDARNHDPHGFPHKSSAIVSLNVEAAIELHAALTAAINAAENQPPVPGIWADLTNRAARRLNGRAI